MGASRNYEGASITPETTGVVVPFREREGALLHLCQERKGAGNSDSTVGGGNLARWIVTVIVSHSPHTRPVADTTKKTSREKGAMKYREMPKIASLG